MALSDHIKDLITAYKAMPNGERRNKVVSHLKDAEAHALLMNEQSPSLEDSADSIYRGNSHAVPPDLPPVQCICRPGMRNSACPATVHVA